VENVDSGMKDFTFLPGIEAVPYYSWGRNVEGSPVLRHLHRHILIMGLNHPSDLENLPSIESGFPARFTRSSLLRLFWLVPFLIALFILTIPPGKGRESRRSPLSTRVSAWIVLFVSAFSLAEAYPFRESTIDQYPPDREEVPYQMLIDYVNTRGGLTFWAHPEAAYRLNMDDSANPISRILFKIFLGGGLSLETDPYPDLLNATGDYTGFAIFNEGAAVIGKPEGLWDDLLMQFCTGNRARPVWAIAELDLESGTSPDIAGETSTVLLVREKTPGEYLAALREGKMYCFTAYMDKKFTIREYAVISGDVRAVSGELLDYKQDARLVFEMNHTGSPLALEAVVMKDGKIFARNKTNGSGRIEIALPPPENGMGYVRIALFQGPVMVAATNPIFMKKGAGS
jgi:hypothetical protein